MKPRHYLIAHQPNAVRRNSGTPRIAPNGKREQNAINNTSEGSMGFNIEPVRLGNGLIVARYFTSII